MIEEEALGFLRNFWGDRQVLQRIFDPRGYDFYQARELSYAVDFLDAQWVRQLLARDVLFFVPPSAVAASLAVVAIGLRLVPRALPGLHPAVAWLVLLTYLSNFAVASTTGLLYRATKPLVAPLLLVLLLLALAEHRRPRMGPRAAFAAVFATGLAMSLLDRQGLFYLLLFIPVAGVAWLRSGRGLALVLGAAGAFAAWAAYNWALGPWVIHALNGYWPETRFQRLRPGWLMRPEPWLEGARLLGDWARVLVGGIPLPAVGAAGRGRRRGVGVDGAAPAGAPRPRRPGRLRRARGPGRHGRDHGAAPRPRDLDRPPLLVLPPALPGPARVRPAVGPRAGAGAPRLPAPRGPARSRGPRRRERRPVAGEAAS